VGGQAVRAEPGGYRRRRQEAGLHGGDPKEKITSEYGVGDDHAGLRSPAHPLGQQRPQEQRATHALRRHVGHRGTGKTPTHRVYEHRAQQRRHQVGGEHDIQRSPGVLHAAHPAVACRGQHQPRNAPGRQPQPIGRGGGDVTSPAGHRPGQRLREDLQHGQQQHADEAGEPRRLYALSQRRRPVAGAETLGGSAGRPVGHDDAQPHGHRQDAATGGQRGECRSTELADHCRVHQQVHRLGRQHDECRER
jgi:hypothetical protein